LYYLSQNYKNYRISRHIDNTLYYKNRKIVLLNTKWLSTQLLQNTYEKNININNKYYQKITNLLTYIEKKKKLINNFKNTLLSNKFRKNKEQFCLKKTLQYKLCKKLYQKKYRNHKRKTWNGVIKNSFYWKRLRKSYVYLNNGVNFRKRREKTNFISLNPRFWINKFRFGHGITKCGKKKFKRRGYIGSYHSYPWLNPILYKKRLYRFSKENVYLRLKRPNLHKRNKIYFNYTRILFNKWNPSIKKQRYFYLKTILSKIILAVYGHLRLKQFKKLVKSNNRIKPKHNTRLSYLLSRFERRLDVLVYRMNIAPTIQWSRELIRLGMITVDSVVTQKPHYLVNNFSLVQYVCNKKHKNRLEYFFNKKLLKKTVPSFLLYNSRLNAGLLLHSPKENMLLNNDRTKIKLLNILRLSN
jgi:ribosomal protein S4